MSTTGLSWIRLARTASVLLPLSIVTVVVPSKLLLADDSARRATGTITAKDEFPRDTLTSSDGSELALADARGRVATVIMCMSVECPISNEFLPAIKEVAQKYCKQGVQFIGIDPNAGETLDVMAAYAEKHKLPFPFAKDDGGKLARELLFNVTPEARVFDASGKIVYRGRVDDRYRAGSSRDPDQIRQDLAEALDEVIAGKGVSHARTRPVGCPIQLTVPEDE